MMLNPKSMRPFCFLLLTATSLFAIGKTGRAEGAKPVRLTIVSMPKGDGADAEAARSLIPVNTPGFQLIPIDLSDASVTDAGVDATEEASEKGIAEAAREAALAFDLVAAAELWRRAADEDLRSKDTALDPRRVASVLLEAGAASVAAGETDLALGYFRKSIAVDGDIRPGPEISPDAKTVFQQALEQGPALLDAPREAVLDEICETMSTDGVVWISVGIDNGEWTVMFKTYLKGEAMGEVETRRYSAPLTGAALAAEQKRFEGIVTRKPAAAAPLPLVTIKPIGKKLKKPWYKKWWFYTAVGGVLIAGGAVGIAVWAATRPETADVTFNY